MDMYPAEDNCYCYFSVPWGYIIPLIIGSQLLGAIILNKLVKRHDVLCAINNEGETAFHLAAKHQHHKDHLQLLCQVLLARERSGNTFM